MARGSIRPKRLKSGKVKYEVVVDLGYDPDTNKRRQRSKLFDTEREAEKRLAAWLTEIDKGTAVDRTTQTLGAYLTYWLEDVHTGLRSTTRESYTYLIATHIAPALGAHKLQKLTPQHLQTFISHKQKGGRADGKPGGLSPSTVRSCYVVLHEALEHAARTGLVARNVADLVTPPPVRRSPPKRWTLEQLQAFLAATHNDYYGPIWLLAASTGMRRGELLGLRWADVDFDRATVEIAQQVVATKRGPKKGDPKTDAGKRKVDLSAGCLLALREHKVRQKEHRLRMGANWEDHDLVFPAGNGKPATPSNLFRHYKKLVQGAGLPHIPIHGLRHTHATLLMANGEHIKVVSERLGHANIMITLSTYVGVQPGMQKQAAARFDDLLTTGK